jgi:glycosyltransferase involved in cell wall biosynthesis
MKKILLLGDINSSHIKKWASGVASLGYHVGIFSMSSPEMDWYSSLGIKIIANGNSIDRNALQESDISKLKYSKFYNSLRKGIEEFSPDIIHAHYATSYGMLGAKTKFHPYILSVWGSDVFDFPRRSIFHRWFLKRNFRKADLILSTSNIMKDEISKYSNKPILVTPFGIDLNEFNKKRFEENKIFTIGIIKSLEDCYGIEYLIIAFDKLLKKYQGKNLRLIVVGDGSAKDKFQKLASDLNLTSHVEFTGKISQQEVPSMHNKFDVFVCPSLSESFGVSVLEASACEVPVVVTNVGGLKEVVLKNETGLFVEPKNPDAIAEAISYFIDNPEKIAIFGKKGRQFVDDNFNWKKNLTEINDIYKQF